MFSAARAQNVTVFDFYGLIMTNIERLENHLALLDDPSSATPKHLAPLVFFAAEAARDLQQKGGNGSHPTWTVLMNNRTLVKHIVKECVEKSHCCASLLALPQNPMTPLLITALGKLDRDRALNNSLRAFKSLVEWNAPDALEDLFLIIQTQMKIASAKDRQIYSIVCKKLQSSPFVHPHLTTQSFRWWKDNQNPSYPDTEEFLRTLAREVNQSLQDAPLKVAHTAQIYIANLGERFETHFYTSLLGWLAWSSNTLDAIDADFSEMVAVLDQQPGFEVWLNKSLKWAEEGTYSEKEVLTLMASHQQKARLTASTLSCAPEKSKKKI